MSTASGRRRRRERPPLSRPRRRGRPRLGSPIQGGISCHMTSRLEGGRRKEILLLEERIRQQFALLGLRDRRYHVTEKGFPPLCRHKSYIRRHTGSDILVPLENDR